MLTGLFDNLSVAIGLIGAVIWITAFFYSRITGKKFPGFLIIFILACFCNAWYGRRQPGSVHVFIPSVMSGYCIILGVCGLIELAKMAALRM